MLFLSVVFIRFKTILSLPQLFWSIAARLKCFTGCKIKPDFPLAVDTD